MSASIKVTGVETLKKRLEKLKQLQFRRKEVAEKFAETNRHRAIPVRSGRLRGSLTNPGHPDFISEISSDGKTVRVGTRVPYAGKQRRLRRLTPQEKSAIFMADLETQVKETLS